MSGASITAEPPVKGAPPSAGPGRWRKYAVAAAFLAPAAVLLGVWIVYPTVKTIIRSLFDRSGPSFTSSSPVFRVRSSSGTFCSFATLRAAAT